MRLLWVWEMQARSELGRSSYASMPGGIATLVHTQIQQVYNSFPFTSTHRSSIRCSNRIGTKYSCRSLPAANALLYRLLTLLDLAGVGACVARLD